MKRFGLISIIIFLILFLFKNCTIDKNSESDSTSIYENVWKFEKLETKSGNAVLTPESNWEYSIQIQENDSIKVVAACNKGDGFVTITENNTVQIQLSCTEMGCSNSTLNFDYCDALNNASRFDTFENKLRIYYTNRTREELILIHHK